MFINNETLPTYFRVKTPNRREHCRITCPTFLPFICLQMTIAWSSLLLKMIIYIFSFSGHPPKTGSVANFLSFDFFVRNSIYDILWIIILEKKGSSHIGQCNYPTFDATIYRLIDIFFWMTTFLQDYRLSAWLSFWKTTLLRRTHKTRQVFKVRSNECELHIN